MYALKYFSQESLNQVSFNKQIRKYTAPETNSPLIGIRFVQPVPWNYWNNNTNPNQEFIGFIDNEWGAADRFLNFEVVLKKKVDSSTSIKQHVNNQNGTFTEKAKLNVGSILNKNKCSIFRPLHCLGEFIHTF